VSKAKGGFFSFSRRIPKTGFFHLDTVKGKKGEHWCFNCPIGAKEEHPPQQGKKGKKRNL